jgi:uncharacterized membrane protein
VAHSSESSSRSLEHVALGALGGALLAAEPDGRGARTLARGVGLALIAYAAKPIVERLILAAGAKRREVALRSFVEVDRPLPGVFAFFKDFENLPRVVGALRSVVDYQDGRSHWEGFTPAGHLVEWDVVVTKYVPNTVIAWESTPNKVADLRVQLRFSPITPARTRIEVEAFFSPVVTDLAEAVSAILAGPSERRLRAEFDHVRFYLESVLPPAPLPETPAPDATPVPG